MFKLQDVQTGEIKFDVSLGSYDLTTELAISAGEIGPDDRYFHLDGYAPNGAHTTYGFFKSQPTYDVVKNTAFKVLAGDLKPISSTVPTVE